MIDLKEKGRKLLLPIVYFLIKTGVSPNLLTLTCIFASAIVAFLYANGIFILAGILLLIFSLLDTLDGELARKKDEVTNFGALLDSTSDRIQEGFVFLGLLIFFRDNIIKLIIIFIAFLLSFIISYIRARGEGLGFSTRKGPMERAERVIWISLTSLMGKDIFIFLLIPFIILLLITITRRVVELKKNL